MDANCLCPDRNIAPGRRDDDVVAHCANDTRGCLLWVYCIVDPAKNEITIAVIFEIGVELGKHAPPFFR